MQKIALFFALLSLATLTVTDAEARGSFGGVRNHSTSSHIFNPTTPQGMMTWMLIMPNGKPGRACTDEEIRKGKCKQVPTQPTR
jgi:hypothetical protein